MTGHGLLQIVAAASGDAYVEEAARHANAVRYLGRVDHTGAVEPFLTRLDVHLAVYFGAARVLGLHCLEAAQRILNLLLRASAPDFELLSATTSGAFLAALRTAHAACVPADASAWLLAAANRPPDTPVRSLADTAALWAAQLGTRDGVERLMHCVVAIKWVAERDSILTPAPLPARRDRDADASQGVRDAGVRLPRLAEPASPPGRAAAHLRQHDVPLRTRRGWRKAVAKLLQPLGLDMNLETGEYASVYTSDAFELAFERHAGANTAVDLFVLLCGFAGGGYAVGGRASTLTAADLGFSAPEGAKATAPHYNTALRRFIDILMIGERVGAAEAAAAAAGAAEERHDDEAAA